MPSPFDRLMTTIRPHLPGAIDNAIKIELFQTCVEFLKVSEVWQEKLPFTVPYMGDSGDVVPVTGRVERLVTVQDAEDNYIRGATMPVPGTIQLPHLWSETTPASLFANMAMVVSDPDDTDAFPIMPADIIARHTDVLIDGILSRMMAQPSKPYTNMTLAQYRLLKFKGGTARARNDFRAMNTSGSQRWAFPQTFRV